MAAKLLHSLADENPDLQKQIGCMTGVFQLFDRQPIFIGGGNSNSRSLERESDDTRLRSASRLSRQSLDIRDLAKDSMYREVQSLSSTKAKSKGESSGPAMKNYRDEPRELLRSASYHMKEGPSFLVSRDIAPRLSYDGRETRDVSKSTLVKLKDTPRLSLDSRDNSMQESTVELGGQSQSQTQVQISQQKPINLTRPPSVVAKLMGLETLLDSVSGKSYPYGDIVNMSTKTDGNSSRNLLWKEPSSPRWRNADPLLRFPIEPAPWKHIDSSKGSQKIASRTTRVPAKGSKSFPSVYSEIEKRLKDLEFAQSGKDLRALKQILEAMQSKGFMELQGNEQKHSNSIIHESRSVSHNQYESPIVIMKPGNMVVEKSGIPAASLVNSINRKNDRTTKTAQTPSRLSKDGNRYISSRMQQKKVELERQSRPPTPNPSKSRRQPNKQQRPKQTRDIIGESRYETESSVQSNESILRGSKSERSTEVSSCQSLSVKASKFMLSDLVDKKSTMGMSEVESAELGFVPPEYSSPVSVLDKVVCKDDSPSPVKYAGKTIRAKERDLESGSTSEISRKKFQNIDNLVQKLRRLNSTHDEASTDYIASLCENTNPDHRYVSEILLASGLLLRELSSNLTNFQFHPSGHPINPELFLVLEQTKARTLTEGKFHRKLIFDTVNEILARKLALEDTGKQVGKRGVNAQKLLRDLCLEIELLQGKNPRFGFGDEEEDDGWKGVLCEDVLHQSGSWKTFEDAISGAVLDIERSIFKDLVNDVVAGESSAGLKTSRPGRRRLFGK